MTLNEMAGIAQSISITLAGLFAIYGFDAWRREFVGKRRMELAEEVLALFLPSTGRDRRDTESRRFRVRGHDPQPISRRKAGTQGGTGQSVCAH